MYNLICKNCGKEFQNKKHPKQEFCCKGCATSNRQKIDDPDFMKEEGEFKYYMLGLIYADGCISKQVDKLERMTLALKDREFIEKIKPFVCPERKLYKSKPKKETHSISYVLVNTNIDTLNTLKQFGVVYRKSKIIKMPQLNDEQFRHFIRGFFDGDGCIFFNTVNEHTYKHVSFTTASEDFVISVQDRLNKLGFEMNIVSDNRKKETKYLKLYKQEDIKRFSKWLYSNAKWFLQRKCDRFYGDIV